MSKLATLPRIVMLGIFLGICLQSNAQPPDPPSPDPDEEVPISGVEILIGAGGLLGAKKYYDLRKKRAKR